MPAAAPAECAPLQWPVRARQSRSASGARFSGRRAASRRQQPKQRPTRRAGRHVGPRCMLREPASRAVLAGGPARAPTTSAGSWSRPAISTICRSPFGNAAAHEPAPLYELDVSCAGPPGSAQVAALCRAICKLELFVGARTVGLCAGPARAAFVGDHSSWMRYDAVAPADARSGVRAEPHADMQGTRPSSSTQFARFSSSSG